ncbi:MAG: VOC family protein [Gemmatimonadota bacterium]|nr:VOC family protein [Gemmatimonadota bacterium]
MSSDYRGRFLWHELLTTDPKGAQSFYRAVTGWSTQAFDESPTPYMMWTNNGVPLGGVLDLPQHLRDRKVPPNWLTYIGTPDVDRTLAQAEKLGGVPMVPARDIPTVGRFAVLGDPQGAVFAIYTPAREGSGSDAPPQPGNIVWNELVTTDHGKAFEFYSALFGWVKTTGVDMGGMGLYQMFGRPGGIPLGGMFNKTKEMPMPPNWLPYVGVGDLDATVETVRKQGGKVLHGPADVPGGRIVQGMDPQGAMFALHQATAQT